METAIRTLVCCTLCAWLAAGRAAAKARVYRPQPAGPQCTAKSGMQTAAVRGTSAVGQQRRSRVCAPRHGVTVRAAANGARKRWVGPDCCDLGLLILSLQCQGAGLLRPIAGAAGRHRTGTHPPQV